MPNNQIIDDQDNFEYDQVDLEALESSDAMLALTPESVANNQSSETNEILAEMCFLEAEDLLAQEDRKGAIVSYQQACKYAPNKINYSLKLIDVLLEDQTTIKEAEQILNKSLAIFPSNLELNIRLNKLKNKTASLNNPINRDINVFLETSEITTQKVFREEIKAVASAMGVDLDESAKQIGLTKETAALLKEIDELETKSVTSSLSSKKITAKENKLNNTNNTKLHTSRLDEIAKEPKVTNQPTSDNPQDILKEIDELESKSQTASLKVNNTRKLSETALLDHNVTDLDNSKKLEKGKPAKTKALRQPVKEGLSKNVSASKKFVIALTFLVVLVGFSYSLFFAHPTITLGAPNKESSIEAKDIKFEWNCDKKNIQFVLEVYQDEVFFIKEFTKETSFTPSPEQLKLFSPEHTYKWRVASVNGYNNYDFVTTVSIFSVSKGVEPVLNLGNPKSQTPENLTPVPTPTPLKKKPSENFDRKPSPEGQI